MNVLLVRAGALGDVLLLRTAVAALRAAGHGVSLLAPSGAGRVLRGPGPGEVDSVLPWEAASMASLLGAPDQIAPEARRALAPFDAIVAYTSSATLVQALGATGARVIARAPLPPAGGPHAARWLADAVVELGGDASLAPPLLRATKDEQAQAQPWLDRLGAGFLAVHPGSGSRGKNWPPERFASLVEATAAGQPWLLVEGPADHDDAAPLARLRGAVHAHDLPPRVLGGVLAHAGVYVGNDSGVSHLAAAGGAPVVALFGPTDAGLWSPLGPKVTIVASADGTMEGIEVAAVKEGVARIA